MRASKESSDIWVEKNSMGSRLMMKESYGTMDTPYSIHPGGTKMYQDLKETFWWHGMKHDIAFFIARCDVCQRVKAEHQRPAGLRQPLKIPV
jgi:hypothetical protein